MKIGIVGLGVVGSAIKEGFEKLGHNVSYHDIAYDTKVEDVLSSDVCYVCVPTPSKTSGQCDTSIVEKVTHELCDHGYEGLIAIKSTVEPGTTLKLIEQTGYKNICFVPEFLRERCAVADFIENHDLCVVGTNSDKIYNLIKESHGSYPKKFVKLTIKEAEFVKYFNNVYNAALITFANNFCELCEKVGVNYANVKNAIVNRKHIHNSYLDCNDNFRGFGGVCLPKDTRALAYMASKHSTGGKLFERIMEENTKYRTTVQKGMRDE
jgi:UDPglucose 6-dehydrogenase